MSNSEEHCAQFLRHPEVLADEVGEPRRTTAPALRPLILRGSLRSHLRMTGNGHKPSRSRDAVRTRVFVTRREFLRSPHRSSSENAGGGHRHLTICTSSHVSRTEESKEAERRETRSPRPHPSGMRRARSAARSPLGVPPRHLLQRANATAQPQLRASWDGTSEERVLPAPGRPAVQRSLDRRPVIVPAGRIRQGRPGTAVTSRRPREPTLAPLCGVTV